MITSQIHNSPPSHVCAIFLQASWYSLSVNKGCHSCIFFCDRNGIVFHDLARVFRKVNDASGEHVCFFAVLSTGLRSIRWIALSTFRATSWARMLWNTRYWVLVTGSGLIESFMLLEIKWYGVESWIRKLCCVLPERSESDMTDCWEWEKVSIS